MPLDISEEQKEVLELLTKDFLTPKKIALRRKTSIQAVYKTIKKLKNKGIINNSLQGVVNIQPTIQPPQSQIRLHATEFNIKILYKDERYKRLLDKSNIIRFDGNTIRLFKDSLEVYMVNSIYADDEFKAEAKLIAYTQRFLQKIENDLKVIIIKPRSQNIKIIRQHFAHTNNGLAKEYIKEGDKINIYTKDDGKLWFQIDNSFNLHEAETMHHETAKADMTKVREFFNDLRDNELPNPSKMYEMLTMVAKNQVIFDKNMQSHIKAIQELANGMRKFNKQLDKLSQKKLSDF